MQHRNHGVTYYSDDEAVRLYPITAGGIEASASTEDQIIPPIMGAGAFIMAEFTNTLIARSFDVSNSGSLIFHFVLLYVHLMAVKAGFEAGISAVSVWTTVKEVFIPLPLG